jgi:hypothetical protein
MADDGAQVRGPRVEAWVDRAGSSAAATQAAPERQPSIARNVLPGHDAVRFDGVDDCLSVPQSPTATAGVTAILIASSDRIDPQPPTPTPGAALALDAADPSTYWIHPAQAWVLAGLGAPQPMRHQRREPIGEAVSWAMLHIQGASQALYVEGSPVTMRYARSTGRLGASALIGCGPDGGAFAGSIFEVLIYDRPITPTERVRVAQYVRGRYGLIARAVLAQRPPRVSVRVTAQGGRAQEPATLTIAATATPATTPIGTTPTTIAKVELFGEAVDESAGGLVAGELMKLAEFTQPPFTHTLPNMPRGKYRVVAVATDSLGVTGTSTAAMITVAAPNAKPPTVRLTSKIAGGRAIAPATIDLTATVTAPAVMPGRPAVTIEKLELFVGDGTDGAWLKLAEFAQPPYAHQVTGLPAGDYVYLARATDSNGLVGESSRITVKVADPAIKPPTVRLVAKAQGGRAVDPATIELTASVTVPPVTGVPAGTVTAVEFFQDGVKLGEVTEPPYTRTIEGLHAGTYAFTARATDSRTMVGVSTAVSVTVLPTPDLKAPTVRVRAGGLRMTAPADVPITVTATPSGTGNTIRLVEVFVGTVKLREMTAPPFTFTWDDVPEGTYAVTAQATDALGVVGRSDETPVTVAAAPEQKPPTVRLTARSGLQPKAPATITLSATATPSGTGNRIARVEFFANEVKLGQADASPWSLTWEAVPEGAYSLTARATDALGVSGVSTPVSLTVTPATTEPPAGRAPIVRVTVTSGMRSTAPATVSMRAIASPSAGGAAIQRVEFYANDVKIGQATAAPYELTWTDVPEGAYGILAKAIDAVGLVGSSTAVTVTVAATPALKPPTVRLTSRTLRPTAPATIELSAAATAMGTDNSIVRVEFFVDQTKLGQLTEAPFTFTWTGVPGGAYALVARATDAKGAVGTSTPLMISVNPTPERTPPTVRLTARGEGLKPTAPARVTLTAVATPARTIGLEPAPIRLVEFFASPDGAGDAAPLVKVGQATAEPYTLVMEKLPAGTYGFVAVATDTAAQVGTSTQATITIEPATIKPPTVRLRVTSDGLRPVEPATLAIEATVTIPPTFGATPPTVARVEFFGKAVSPGAAGAVGAFAVGAFAVGDPVKLGEANAAPYILRLERMPAGTYEFTAVATDSTGVKGSSSAATVTIAARTVTPPTVRLTAKAAGLQPKAPSTVTLTATATLPSAPGSEPAQIVRVDFYEGALKIGEAAASPYTLTLPNLPARTYTFTARALDSRRQIGTSTAVTLTIAPGSGTPSPSPSPDPSPSPSPGPSPSPTPGGPTVRLTSPTDGAHLPEPATITMTAATTGVLIRKVEFFAERLAEDGPSGLPLKVGEDTLAPYSHALPNMPAGRYALSATVTDSQARTATSTVVTVTVNAAGAVGLRAAAGAMVIEGVGAAPAAVALPVTLVETGLEAP